ncbi:MAG: hypothetical protein JWQ57_4995 [Mucilaginibacter sp.]|nr:hypothetical protein [Mucilaginibacter sp.]
MNKARRDKGGLFCWIICYKKQCRLPKGKPAKHNQNQAQFRFKVKRPDLFCYPKK